MRYKAILKSKKVYVFNVKFIPFQTAKERDIRLPSDIVPLSYNLQLVPFIIPDNFTISGTVSIELACFGDTTNITLHSKQKEINSLNVLDSSGTELAIDSKYLDPERDFLVVQMKDPLIAGSNYTLEIEFVSDLSEGLSGFYRSTYTENDGKKMTIATTHFEPTSARKAFPCFDEPALKATFEISLGRTRDMVALSNMPIKEGQRGVKM